MMFPILTLAIVIITVIIAVSNDFTSGASSATNYH
jgi:hypothetical protein